jgi:predicted RecA/RadA family phage recombinase
MPLEFVQDGKAIDYTPAGAVPAGTCTTSAGLLGVTKHQIPAGALGSLHIAPEVYKLLNDLTAFTAGDNVYITLATQLASSSTSGTTLFGKCLEDTASSSPTVLARLKTQ